MGAGAARAYQGGGARMKKFLIVCLVMAMPLLLVFKDVRKALAE